MTPIQLTWSFRVVVFEVFKLSAKKLPGLCHWISFNQWKSLKKTYAKIFLLIFQFLHLNKLHENEQFVVKYLKLQLSLVQWSKTDCYLYANSSKEELFDFYQHRGHPYHRTFVPEI